MLHYCPPVQKVLDQILKLTGGGGLAVSAAGVLRLAAVDGPAGSPGLKTNNTKEESKTHLKTFSQSGPRLVRFQDLELLF